MLPEQWSLERRSGRLHLDGHDLTGLAEDFGTPLHVASARIVRERAAEMKRAFGGYSAPVRIHFSYKTNLVAGILRVLHDAGVQAEVVNGYELWLAQRLGVAPDDIVFNGPNKSDQELLAAVEADVGLLVVDGLGELSRVAAFAAARGTKARIGLRICPDVVPRRMNASSLTGSRKNQFGLDLRDGEARAALEQAVRSPHLRLRGFMAHIGSGIHDLGAFRDAVDRLLGMHVEALRLGAEPDLIDLGGGLGARRSREFTTLEMLAYLGLGRLPKPAAPEGSDLFDRYADAVSTALEQGCARQGCALPALVLEPGRALVSDAQVLLLQVGAVRGRKGVGEFALTDGGAMTSSMMFLSERHQVFLANRDAPDEGRTSVFGALPSPMDVVYRNLPCPRLQRGDLLAVMDAGAYFTSTSTNFGGPRPAVVLLDGARAKLVRRRETFEDLARVELDVPEPETSAVRLVS
ncbi:MAG: hypothetical protein JRI55_22860 [Deltaproteobacteria bacterium]|jgi:diaminopimelate decarboxylase|nr:hypothetical protein [Deltaproteobacteria bacterium]